MAINYDSCELRIDEQLKRIITGIKRLRENLTFESDYNEEDNKYISVLSTDYVAPNTFNYQKDEGYYRIQFSWGGPSDELRVYFNKNRYTTIEYWFLDWFDGAFRNVTTDEDILWYVDLFNFDKTINKEV